ncbi:hypothetical protein J4Q44_G00018000 [Coregonus suidteri]|uniref:Uncharacterized protein n=1 Tax=Coregonus suidteri TaxID=861788 RepID=A0AAN8ML83_9TELE
MPQCRGSGGHCDWLCGRSDLNHQSHRTPGVLEERPTKGGQDTERCQRTHTHQQLTRGETPSMDDYGSPTLKQWRPRKNTHMRMRTHTHRHTHTHTPSHTFPAVDSPCLSSECYLLIFKSTNNDSLENSHRCIISEAPHTQIVGMRKGPY